MKCLKCLVEMFKVKTGAAPSIIKKIIARF